MRKCSPGTFPLDESKWLKMEERRRKETWNHKKEYIQKIMSILIAGVFALGYIPVSFAEDSSQATVISGQVYTFGEKDHYEYSLAEAPAATDTVAIGTLSAIGGLVSDGMMNGVKSFAVDESSVPLIYSYTDSLLTAPEEQWHLVEDKTKRV